MAKTVSQNILKGQQVIEVQYDFANDGGSVGALDLFTAPVDMVIHQAYLKVVTTCTSLGSATVIAGVVGGDTDAIITLTTGAVANLTANAVIPGDAACVGIRLASGGKIGMAIGTAALTAGKFKLVLVVSDF